MTDAPKFTKEARARIDRALIGFGDPQTEPGNPVIAPEDLRNLLAAHDALEAELEQCADMLEKSHGRALAGSPPPAGQGAGEPDPALTSAHATVLVGKFSTIVDPRDSEPPPPEPGPLPDEVAGLVVEWREAENQTDTSDPLIVERTLAIGDRLATALERSRRVGVEEVARVMLRLQEGPMTAERMEREQTIQWRNRMRDAKAALALIYGEADHA